MSLVDQAARDRIATDLDSTLMVEAAAGTGKTTALVGRVISLLRTGRARLTQVVALTFTHKAAGELRLRLRAAVEVAHQEGTAEERPRLERALRELEVARIGTIHSFCGDLLRERPVQAGIDPTFEVATDPDKARLFGEAFEGWFQAALADPPEGVGRLLRRPPDWKGDGPRAILRAAGFSLVQRRDYRARWSRPAFDRRHAIDALMAALDAYVGLREVADHPDSYLVGHLDLVHGWAAAAASREAAVGRDYDLLEVQLKQLTGHTFKWHWKGHPYRPFSAAESVSVDDVIVRRKAFKAQLDRVVAACDADLAACLQPELMPLIDAYEALKRQAGKLDFIDLMERTRELLVRDPGVRAELQARFTHLLVDEFQDNDPLQTDIVLLLASNDPSVVDPGLVHVEPGKLFLVGDPKQSIYRFRRADVGVYHAVKRRLREQGAEVLLLTTSFRGDPRIQAMVNGAFAGRMTGGTQADYVPLERFRAEAPGRPAVVALGIPEPYTDYGKVYKSTLRSSAPGAVAAWVHWLLTQSGWTITDPGTGEPVPVEARHVCLLFRNLKAGTSSITAPYTRGLEARGVAHVLVGGRSFHQREEVLAMRNVLTAIEWPDDELSVFATLRGPLFAVGDDALLAWRHRCGALAPLGEPPADLSPLLQQVAEPLALLAQLHRARNRRPIGDTFTRLLDATRAHAGLALWAGGEQVLANVLALGRQARAFEAGGATSFRAFVQHLTTEAERGETGEAAVVEEGTDGVRIMTAHKAKGLEFPVVVLCDPACGGTWSEPSAYVDAERGLWAEKLAGCVPADLLEHAEEVLRLDAEEADRLVYVAATRARDLLVVTAVGDQRFEGGWLEPLYSAIYPKAPGRPVAPVPGCPPLGDDTVAGRPRQTACVVRPGLHEAQSGGHAVVWWGAQALHLDTPKPDGMRNMKILTADDAGVAAAQAAAHAAWIEAREVRLEEGAEPSEEIATPTDLALAYGDDTKVAVVDTWVDRVGRPRGKRFGTLVHAVLADVPLDADRPIVAASCTLHGRLTMATAGEVEAAVGAVVEALDHDLLRRARRSPDVRREVPLSRVVEDETMVEGIADLAFKEDGGWMVVDFKTGDTLPEAAHIQVRAYVDAVVAATGEPARGVLMRV